MALRIEMLPAEEGDALWIEWGDIATGRVRRMLVDAGRKSTYRLIADRMRRDPAMSFDLFVITHIDVDHIQGAVPLLGDAAVSPDRIGEVWFNGFRHLGPKDLLGGKDGAFLESTIERGGHAWNEAFGGSAIAIADDGPLPHIRLAADLRVTLLGPTRERLRALRRKWVADLTRAGIDPDDTDAILAAFAESSLHQPDRLGDIPVERLLSEPFVEDDSVPNGSSIALLLEHDGLSVLLAADAHAGDLAVSVRRLLSERGEKRLRLDALKVSHHGSKRNSSPELLDLLDCKRFLISTNGGRHGHPDDAAIARLASRPGRPTLFFNYSTARNRRWADRALQREIGFTAVYPPSEDEGLVVDLAHAPIRSADRGVRAGERRLGAAIVDESVLRLVDGSLDAGRAYRVDFSIGHDVAVELADSLPPVDFERPDGSTVLDVVFWDPALSPVPSTAQMRLPREGRSSTVSFFFSTSSTHINLRARVVLLRQQRVLQTGILTCDVDGPRLVIDAQPQRTLQELRGSRGAAALVVDGDDVLRSDPVERAAVVHVDRGDIDELVQRFSGLLEPADGFVPDPNQDALHQLPIVDALYKLALKGSLLHRVVAKSGTGDSTVLAGTGRVQVVTTRYGDFFPAELLYRLPPPENVSVCPRAVESLVAGECSADCPEGSAKGNHVCPLGFWGLSRVIERHARIPNADRADGRVLFRIPRGGDDRPFVQPRRGPAVFAASDRAFEVTGHSVQAARVRIEMLVDDVEIADDWAAWRRQVAAVRPSLLVLFPHHERRGGSEALEIGGSCLLSEQMQPRYVGVGGLPGPLVLLLGCETQLARISFESFTASFIDSGAAMVVSTIAGVLGRDVLETTEMLLSRLPAPAIRRDHPSAAVSLSHAVLAVRRALVAKGKLMGLALTAHGDADCVVR